jgi:hypothetical protein
MDWILEEVLEVALLIGGAAILLELRTRWRPQMPGHALIRAPFAPLSPAAVGGHQEGPGRRQSEAPVAWAHRIRAESARRQEDGWTAAVVAIRIDGLDGVAPDVRNRIDRAAAASVRAVAPNPVLVHDDDRGTFRVLLLETDERGARAYVDEVTRPLGRWLDDPGRPVRLTAAWAATSAERDLLATERLAEARLVGASAGWIRSAATWRSPMSEA